MEKLKPGPKPAYADPLDRIADSFEITQDGCWEWTGSKFPSRGYARITIENKGVMVQRYLYNRIVRPLAKDTLLKRLCDMPHCINPDHVEPTEPGVPGLRYFLERVRIGDGCWEWVGSQRKKRGGYGFMYAGGGRKAPKAVPAHRYSYQLFKGPIPDGLVVDHLCRNPPCVHPDHLEAVTQKENIRRRVPTCETRGGGCCLHGNYPEA